MKSIPPARALRATGPAVLATLLASLSTSRGEVLLQDDFSTEIDIALHGRIPDPVDGGFAWRDSNEASTVDAGLDQVYLRGAGTTAALPIASLQDNTTYRVSCRLIWANDDWVSPAFFTSLEPGLWWNGTISSFVALKNSGDIEFWPNGFPGDNFTYTPPRHVLGVFAVELRVGADGSAEVAYLWDGETIGSGYPMSAAEVDAIVATGIALSGNTAAEVDDFLFERIASVPAIELRIGEVRRNAGGFHLSGSGGPAGEDFEVLHSPQLTTPLAEWTPIGTGSFSESGDFTFTHATPTGPQAYYVARTTSEGEASSDAPGDTSDP